MDIVAVRDALADTVRDATSLPVYELPTAQVTAPAVLLGAVSGQYDLDLDGAMTLTWPLVVIVSRSHPDALSTLATILDTEDDRSIWVALDETSPGTAASWWRVTGFEPWADIDIGGTSFWSATVNVEVVG